MAEVNHFFASQSTLSTDTDTAWAEPTNTCKITGASLAANTKYLVIARGFHGGSSATTKRRLRVSTTDDANIATRSTSVAEPGNTNAYDGQPFLFIRSYTTSGSPTDVKFEQMGDAATNTYTDQLSLTLIDLDDLGSANYIEANDDTTTNLADAGTQLAAITTLAASTEYVFLGYAQIAVDATNASHRVTLRDGTTAKTEVFREGEDSAEQIVHGVMGAWTTAGTPSDVDVFGAAEAGTAADNMSSYLIAIKTDAFADFSYGYDAVGEVFDDDPAVTIETFSYTPSTSGDHLVLGRVNIISAGLFSTQVTVSSTSILAGDFDIAVHGFYDPTDEPQINVAAVVSISATSDIDLDVKTSVVTAETSEHEFIAVLNLNLAGGGTDHTETPTDPVGVTDTVSRVVAAVRTVTDPVGVSDVVSRQVDAARSITDPVGVTDVVAVAKAAAGESTDPVGVADVVSTVHGHGRDITDPVGVTDVVSPVKAAGQTVTDPVGVTDVVGRQVDAARSTTDPVGVTDVVATAKAISPTVTDPVGVTDTTTAVKAAAQTVTDPVGVTDIVSTVKTINVTITESVGVADSVEAAKAVQVTVTDPVGVTDDVSDELLQYILETPTDPVGITDVVSAVMDKAREPTDSVSVADVVSAAMAKARPTTDPVGVADAVVTSLAAARVATDPVGVTDVVSAAKTINVTVSESVGVTDSVGVAKAIAVTVTDGVGVTDIVTAVLSQAGRMSWLELEVPASASAGQVTWIVLQVPNFYTGAPPGTLLLLRVGL